VEESPFEWDPEKAETNQAKHNIGFLGATAVFDDPFYLEEDSTRPGDGEVRLKAIGAVQGEVIAVIFTYRQHRRQIISARRARRNERRKYDQGSQAG
jgi:uncharacterized DUF497 family protein